MSWSDWVGLWAMLQVIGMIAGALVFVGVVIYIVVQTLRES